MTVNKRAKKSRNRGTWTHGGGAKKKRRGKGHRGGVGMAGTGKRAQVKKPSIWKERYFGRRFFTPKGRHLIVNPINVSFVDENIAKFVDKKLAKKILKDDKNSEDFLSPSSSEADFRTKKENCSYSIDLKDLGCNKLLGKGKVRNKLNIKTEYASENAIAAVEEAGGKVEVMNDLEKVSEQKEE